MYIVPNVKLTNFHMADEDCLWIIVCTYEEMVAEALRMTNESRLIKWWYVDCEVYSLSTDYKFFHRRNLWAYVPHTANPVAPNRLQAVVDAMISHRITEVRYELPRREDVL